MLLKSLFIGKASSIRPIDFLNNRAPIRAIPANLAASVSRRISGNHAFIECGKGRPVIFCHGLFGGIYNINKVAAVISTRYRFIMPYLPMYDLPLKDCRVKMLGEYLADFIAELGLDEAVVIGSSMGGGAASYYASLPGNNLAGLVLCGSSGLSNIPLSKGYFKRKDYNFLTSAVQDIFYDRSTPPDEMVQDVFRAIQQTDLVIRSIRFTKSATKEKMNDEISRIQVPSLLVWGKEDPITPVSVAPQFQQLIKGSELQIIENCGHVPMQEKPDEFLFHLFSFLKKINYL